MARLWQPTVSQCETTQICFAHRIETGYETKYSFVCVLCHGLYFLNEPSQPRKPRCVVWEEFHCFERSFTINIGFRHHSVSRVQFVTGEQKRPHTKWHKFSVCLVRLPMQCVHGVCWLLGHMTAKTYTWFYTVYLLCIFRVLCSCWRARAVKANNLILSATYLLGYCRQSCCSTLGFVLNKTLFNVFLCNFYFFFNLYI